MRQVRIRVTCDACAAWHQAETEEGVQTVPVSAGQTLDLCPSHRSDLAPFLALVAEWGASPEQTRKSAPPVAPAAPVRNGNAPSKRGGKRARARRANQEQSTPTTPAVAVDLPLVCPLCASTLANADSLGTHLRTQHQTNGVAVYGGTCPVCNHDGDARGLGTHGSKAHNTTSTAALFALAQEQGDPHGVIASRTQVLAQQ